MLKGEMVVLRPMNQGDIDRQHEFNQDIELYGLDSDYSRVSPFESAKSFYDSHTQFNDDIAPLKLKGNILASVHSCIFAIGMGI